MSAAATPLSAEMLLDLADRAESAGPIERALSIVAAAGEDAERLRGEPLGRLHAAVLAVRAILSGPQLDSVATCPACRAAVEFALDVEGLRRLDAAASRANGSFTYVDADRTEEPALVRYRVHWRAPSAEDLLEASAESDAAAALRGRCIVVIDADGRVVDDAIPTGLADRLEAELTAADPLAEVFVSLDCPECGAAFDADLDPVGFVWAEVEARSRRVLIEVDALARAYGWTEAAVLALSETRRAAYLDLVWGAR